MVAWEKNENFRNSDIESLVQIKLAVVACILKWMCRLLIHLMVVDGGY